VAFHQGRDLAIVAAEQQVTFPVARHRSVRSFWATMRASARFCTSLQVLGRCARSQAACSAWLARYCRRPPLRVISRLIVDGARPSVVAIERSDWPATRPRDISSRSAIVGASLERIRRGGRMPPVCDRMFCIDEWPRPK
jgi:hypothetical protein